MSFILVRHLGKGRESIESISRSATAAKADRDRILRAEPHASLSIVITSKGI